MEIGVLGAGSNQSQAHVVFAAPGVSGALGAWKSSRTGLDPMGRGRCDNAKCSICNFWTAGGMEIGLQGVGSGLSRALRQRKTLYLQLLGCWKHGNRRAGGWIRVHACRDL